MDKYLRLRQIVKERVARAGNAFSSCGDPAEKKKVLFHAAKEAAWEEGLILSPLELQDMLQRLLDDILGLGSLEALLRDEEVTEIMVNGPDQVYVERRGRIYPAQVTLEGEEEVYRIIDRIIGPLGLHVDEASPYVDARLPGGSRVNVILPPLSLLGPVITIRKFRCRPFSLEELVSSGTLSPAAAELLAESVSGKKNLVISGGAGTGKTTLLNALSSCIAREERIITLEDAAELRLQQPHVIPLETRPPNLEGKGEVTLRDLLRNALRMRPDRIIIGEVRGAEALDLLQALNTGHRGSIATIHANSPLDALSRLETMALTAGVGLPSSAVREQIVQVVDLLVHMERGPDGERKVREVSVMDRRKGGRARLLPVTGSSGGHEAAYARSLSPLSSGEKEINPGMEVRAAPAVSP